MPDRAKMGLIFRIEKSSGRYHSQMTNRLALVLLTAASLGAQVRVEKTTWHGWSDAVILRNPVAAVVIVPSIGRIMQFSFLDKAGQPTEGPLWNNRALDGKSVEPSSQQWGNFGGDKSWP